MAKFGQQFLANLNVDRLAQGMFEFGQGLGAAPKNAILTTQIKDEKDRREKGIIGGMMAIQQAASAGQLTPDMAKAAAGSLQGLGMDPTKIISAISSATETNKNQQVINSVAKDFNQWAATNNISAGIREDVTRGIIAGNIKTAQEGQDLAVQNEQKAATLDYYSNVGEYDPRLKGLISRGKFDDADALFKRLNPPASVKAANAVLGKLNENGGIITQANRSEIWTAVSSQAKDLADAISTMNSLEDQSIQNLANKHKGPTKKITYIPKPQDVGQVALYSFGDSKNVPTKQIDAPLDADGNIDPVWFADFKKYSAERIIGMGDETPTTQNVSSSGVSLRTSGNTTSNVETPKPTGQTPLDLLTGFKSTAYNY